MSMKSSLPTWQEHVHSEWRMIVLQSYQRNVCMGSHELCTKCNDRRNWCWFLIIYLLHIHQWYNTWNIVHPCPITASTYPFASLHSHSDRSNQVRSAWRIEFEKNDEIGKIKDQLAFPSQAASRAISMILRNLRETKGLTRKLKGSSLSFSNL